MNNIFNLDSQYVVNTYNRFPIQIVKGKGSYLYDSNGKKYIDMGSGIAVNTFGLTDKKWNKAVKEQLKLYSHTSNLYYTEPCVNLAKMLCEKTDMKKVFFSNSGAEANECAIKIARKYASLNKGDEYFNIITLKKSFHGRTLTTLSATGQDQFHTLFNPLTPGFLHAEPENINELCDLATKNKVAGIMIECVQGEGGVNALSKKFVEEIYNFCKEKDILLIVDEVQTGNGRTGKLYGYMNYDIIPDIITTAKGLGGGLPIGATLLNEKVQNVLKFGEHGSTFGGNPVVCAGAISVLSRIDEKLLDEVNKKSQIIFSKLQGKEGILSVSGKGLMIGIETEKPCKEVLTYCLERGVLVLTAKNKIRLLPALNIPVKLLENALEIIINACKS